MVKTKWDTDDDTVVNVRTDYEVVLNINKDNGEKELVELKVVPVEDKTKTISQIDIGRIVSFAEMLNSLDI